MPDRINTTMVNGGSTAAITGGLFAAAAPTSPTSSVALIVAIGGLVTAIGAQFLPMLRLWVEASQENRKASVARHALLDRVNHAGLEITFLQRSMATQEATIEAQKRTIEENRRLIEALVLNRTIPLIEKAPDEATH